MKQKQDMKQKQMNMKQKQDMKQKQYMKQKQDMKQKQMNMKQKQKQKKEMKKKMKKKTIKKTVYCKVRTGENCYTDTYYLIDKTTMKVLDEGSGSLYYCESKNEPCKEIMSPGYYIDNVYNYYTCDGRTRSCKKEALNKKNSEKNKCTRSNIGKILLIDGHLSLCIDKSIAVPISVKTTGAYIMEPNSKINVFNLGDHQKAIISINGNGVKLFKDYDNNLRYTYAAISTHKILNKGVDSFPTKIGDDGTVKLKEEDIYELVCNNGICNNLNTNISQK